MKQQPSQDELSIVARGFKVGANTATTTTTAAATIQTTTKPFVVVLEKRKLHDILLLVRLQSTCSFQQLGVLLCQQAKLLAHVLANLSEVCNISFHISPLLLC